MNKETTYGLNDVVFEIYDVSEYVRKQREEKKSTQEIQKYYTNSLGRLATI